MMKITMALGAVALFLVSLGLTAPVITTTTTLIAISDRADEAVVNELNMRNAAQASITSKIILCHEANYDNCLTLPATSKSTEKRAESTTLDKKTRSTSTQETGTNELALQNIAHRSEDPIITLCQEINYIDCTAYYFTLIDCIDMPFQPVLSAEATTGLQCTFYNSPCNEPNTLYTSSDVPIPNLQTFLGSAQSFYCST